MAMTILTEQTALCGILYKKADLYTDLILFHDMTDMYFKQMFWFTFAAGMRIQDLSTTCAGRVLDDMRDRSEQLKTVSRCCIACFSERFMLHELLFLRPVDCHAERDRPFIEAREIVG